MFDHINSTFLDRPKLNMQIDGNLEEEKKTTWYSRRLREGMRQVEIDSPDMLVPRSDHLQCGTGAIANVHEHADAVEPFEALQKLANHHHRLLRHGLVE